jgi:hypothetical protein
MKRLFSLLATVFCLFLILTTNTHAAIITFNDAISSATTYKFDSDGDGIKDVIFSTTDPLGFNTSGPGPNMTYIQEPGLEGTSLLNPDLRVDFLNQAKNYLKFGFALLSGSESTNTWTKFDVYDAGGNLLVSQTQFGLFTYPNGVTNPPSSFPEGQISVTFPGTARYALFDFSSDGGRYIIDNFEGTYGSTEVPSVPEPGTLLLLGLGLMGVVGVRRKLRQ